MYSMCRALFWKKKQCRGLRNLLIVSNVCVCACVRGPNREHRKILCYKIHLGILPVHTIAMYVYCCTVFGCKPYSRSLFVMK
jgi:hypothetical protein